MELCDLSWKKPAPKGLRKNSTGIPSPCGSHRRARLIPTRVPSPHGSHRRAGPIAARSQIETANPTRRAACHSARTRGLGRILSEARDPRRTRRRRKRRGYSCEGLQLGDASPKGLRKNSTGIPSPCGSHRRARLIPTRVPSPREAHPHAGPIAARSQIETANPTRRAACHSARTRG